MNTIKLNQYGAVLTGREFGADVMKSLAAQVKLPVCLDFDGVESLGSSFGDEVVPVLAARQNGRITIINANETVRATLRDVATDAKIEIEWI